MTKWVVALLMAASAAISFAQQTGGGGAGAGTGSATLPTATAAGQLLNSTGAGTAYAAQSKISLDPRDFGVVFTQNNTVPNLSTTNGSNVVACPSSNCNFTASMVGWIFFATAGSGTACLDNPAISFGGARQTTITGFTNSNSITVSGNADTTATGAGCGAWFPADYTTQLTNWWAAGGCTGSYVVPPGSALFSGPIMQNLSGCLGSVNQGYAYPGQAIYGAGVGSSFLIPAPVFTYTNLSGNQNTNCAVGNLNIEHMENFVVWGLGERATGAQANTCLLMIGQATSAFRIDAVGWDARGGGATLDGVRMIGITDTFNVGGSNFFGSIIMHHTNVNQSAENNYFSGLPASINGTCGVFIDTAATVTYINSVTNECTEVTGGTLNSIGGTFVNNAGDGADIYLGNGGRLNLLGNDIITPSAGDGINIFAGVGSIVSATNSKISGGSGYVFRGNSGNNFYDNCGNTFTAGSSGIFNNAGLWPSNCSQAGWAATAGNIALGAGWGASASVAITAVSNGDMRHFTMTITNGASGVAQATATIVYTFPNAFAIPPGSCHATQVGGTNPVLTLTTSTLQTTGAVTFTATTIPTISLTEIVAVDCQ